MRPPVESIEIYLNIELADSVRGWWRQLAELRFSSLAHGDHTPHITLVAGPGSADRMLRSVRSAGTWAHELLGTPIALGGIGLFPGERCVLYASVVPTSRMLDAQAALWNQFHDAGIEMFPTSVPGSWTPHCTLAKRMRREDIGVACATLAESPWPVLGHVAQIVHWDGAARRITEIAAC